MPYNMTASGVGPSSNTTSKLEKSYFRRTLELTQTFTATRKMLSNRTGCWTLGKKAACVSQLPCPNSLILLPCEDGSWLSQTGLVVLGWTIRALYPTIWGLCDLVSMGVPWGPAGMLDFIQLPQDDAPGWYLSEHLNRHIHLKNKQKNYI